MMENPFDYNLSNAYNLRISIRFYFTLQIDVSVSSHFQNFVNVKKMMTRTHLKFLRFRIDKKNL